MAHEDKPFICIHTLTLFLHLSFSPTLPYVSLTGSLTFSFPFILKSFDFFLNVGYWTKRNVGTDIESVSSDFVPLISRWGSWDDPKGC